MKFFSVSAPKPCQFVNDRPTDRIVGNQMKNRHRKVGIPTISAIVSRSRRVRIEKLASPRSLDVDRPTRWGSGQGGVGDGWT